MNGFDALFATAFCFLSGRLVVFFPALGAASFHFVGALLAAALLSPWEAGMVAALGLPLQRPPRPRRELLGRARVGLMALGAGLALERGVPFLAVAPLYLGVELGSLFLNAPSWASLVRRLRRGWWRAPLLWAGLLPLVYLLSRLYREPLLTPWGWLDALLLLPLLLVAHAFLRDWLRERELLRETVLALARQVEARDPYTAFHSERVAHIARHLARKMGLPYKEVEAIGLGALLHDIGKVGVADGVLLKEGALTEEEWARMRAHTVEGHRILAPLEPYLRRGVAAIARSHHERWDGLGYPDGLKGEEIPLPARIVAVADAYEAMTSDRPYRKALSPPEAAAHIAHGAGSQFDPEVVKAFLELLREDPPWRERGRFLRESLVF